MPSINTRKRGGSTKVPVYKIRLHLFFVAAPFYPDEKPEYINDDTWERIKEDWIETDAYYKSNPNLVVDKIKSYDAVESIKGLLDVDDVLVDAEWVNSTPAIEFRMKSTKTLDEVKSYFLHTRIEDYLWYKSSDAWNIWTLKEMWPIFLTEYRRPENITVKKVLIPKPRSMAASRKSRKHSRK